MIDIALADGGGGYNPTLSGITSILGVLIFFHIIKLLNRKKRFEFFDILPTLFSYTFVVFGLEIIAFLMSNSPYMASLLSIPIVMIAYYDAMEKNWRCIYCL
jgi:O-antigen/teichoic acid export membrane protein